MSAALKPEQRAYRPYGAAESLMYCRDPEVLLDGPAGTGKSLACLNKVYALCENYPGIRCLIVRATRESLTETGLVTWEDEVVPVGHPALAGPKRNIRQAYHFPNKSEVVIGGMDNAQKVMSGQYDVIYVQEATELTEEDLAHLSTRNRRYAMPYNQIVMDCNPDGPSHWLKLRFERGDTTRFPSRYEDNPFYWDREKADWTWQGREYIAKLDRLPPVMRKRLRHGLWAGAEGAVYDCFDYDRDVIDPIDVPPSWPRFVGLDFGAVNTAAVFFAQDPETDLLYLYREYHAGNRTAGQHAHYLRLGEPAELTVVGGARAEGQWRKEFTVAGLTVLEPTVRDVSLGISRVYGQHKRGGIKVFRTSVGYLAQKVDYRYKRDAQKDEIENKSTYHYLDAERYVISHIRPEKDAMSAKIVHLWTRGRSFA